LFQFLSCLIHLFLLLIPLFSREWNFNNVISTTWWQLLATRFLSSWLMPTIPTRELSVCAHGFFIHIRLTNYYEDFDCCVPWSFCKEKKEKHWFKTFDSNLVEKLRLPQRWTFIDASHIARYSPPFQYHKICSWVYADIVTNVIFVNLILWCFTCDFAILLSRAEACMHHRIIPYGIPYVPHHTHRLRRFFNIFPKDLNIKFIWHLVKKKLSSSI
jgi:hypothetical protein